MSYIKIKFSPVADAEAYLNSAIQDLESIENSIRAVQNSLSLDIQSRYQISTKLSTCKKNISAVNKKAEMLLRTAHSASLDYQNTESKLRKAAPKDNT